MKNLEIINSFGVGVKEIGFIQIFLKRYGGVIYRKQVIDALSKDFKVDTINLEAKYLKKRRYLKFLESFYYLFKLKGGKNLWVRDFYSTLLLSKKRTKGKNLALIFHIDFLKFPFLSRIPLFLLENFIFYGQLKKVDAIVTISEYWKDYFLKKGYKNVYKIYCGFDLNNFNITEEEVLEFKKKYKLEGKPIIYLGNCQKPKGAFDSYGALKGLDVHFITSGKKRVKIPALNFDVDYGEYLKLLKASTIAVTMSKFKEGWCMTAHEAMLLKVPVIGSGMGGMKELLELGGQIICTDFKELKNKVKYLLNNLEEREKIGQKGFNFAKNFTIERFNQEWHNLIKKILGPSWT